jgi:hypothetical protein
MQNIEATHALEAAYNISGGVTFWMTNMQAGSRWIREHV